MPAFDGLRTIHARTGGRPPDETTVSCVYAWVGASRDRAQLGTIGTSGGDAAWRGEARPAGATARLHRQRMRPFLEGATRRSGWKAWINWPRHWPGRCAGAIISTAVTSSVNADAATVFQRVRAAAPRLPIVFAGMADWETCARRPSAPSGDRSVAFDSVAAELSSGRKPGIATRPSWSCARDDLVDAALRESALRALRAFQLSDRVPMDRDSALPADVDSVPRARRSLAAADDAATGRRGGTSGVAAGGDGAQSSSTTASACGWAMASTCGSWPRTTSCRSACQFTVRPHPGKPAGH